MSLLNAEKHHLCARTLEDLSLKEPLDTIWTLPLILQPSWITCFYIQTISQNKRKKQPNLKFSLCLSGIFCISVCADLLLFVTLGTTKKKEFGYFDATALPIWKLQECFLVKNNNENKCKEAVCEIASGISSFKCINWNDEAPSRRENWMLREKTRVVGMSNKCSCRYFGFIFQYWSCIVVLLPYLRRPCITEPWQTLIWIWE